MNKLEIERRLDDRALRYPGAHPLPPDRPVHIHVDPDYAGTYAGQVAAITAASLFGRMSKAVAVSAPPLSLVESLPHVGTTLDQALMTILDEAEPDGWHETRVARREDLRLVIGRGGDGLVVHGSGWGAYRGSGPSPFEDSDEPNPFGSALAAIVAAAQLQQVPETRGVEPLSLDAYLWQPGIPPREVTTVSPDLALGELWCVGVGSVGSCALFFLSLATREFDAVLIDRDEVELENVRRSALFSWRDALAGSHKVDVAHRWLSEAGVERIETHTAWLDEIPARWSGREAGTPDVLISAANERNVRSTIEAAYPPLQVYATTGRNWQATLYRHIPLRDPCSTCVPGSKVVGAPSVCAAGPNIPLAGGGDGGDDVALPFLSYAAGLMTAAEIAKLALTGRATTPNRTFFESRTPGLFRSVGLHPKPGCSCRARDKAIHKAAIRGSRFAPLTSNADDSSREPSNSCGAVPRGPRSL